MKTLGFNTIKSLRDGQGLTQKYMADILGVSECSYCNKENGRSHFSDKEKVRIAKFFDLSANQVNDIFFFF